MKSNPSALSKEPACISEISKNTLSLDIEGFNEGEIETPDSIDENLSDPLEYLMVFINESEFSDEIDKNDLIKTCKEIHSEIQICT